MFILHFYNTDEMAQLLRWMRGYNEKAVKDKDLCFYGFDMHSYDVTYDYFIEAAKTLGADTAELEQIWNTETTENKYTSQQKADIINKVKAQLPDNKNLDTVQAAHFADILVQNIELSETMDNIQAGLAMRDKLMSENVMWILEQEKARGNSRIFISGHNGHFCNRNSFLQNKKQHAKRGERTHYVLCIFP
ncbi:MAG: erythromycin esterase family protein [Bacillota bacterium]|nr:erythromycin esterase family protein [Bacillota bacterium]